MEEKENSEVIQERKNKLKKFFFGWIDDKYDKSFIAVLIFVIAIRLYYLFLTANQPLWWDEAEYMSAAKSYAGIVDFKLDNVRSPGFPLIASILFRLGITNELVLKFFLAFIPSIIAICLFYFLIREMYSDKRIAIISTFLFGVLWEHLFYSMRFHTENFSLIFQFLAMIVLIKVYLKKEKISLITPKLSWAFILLFSIFAILFRPTSAPFIPALLAFGLIMNISYFKKIRKIYLILGAIAIIALIIIFITNLENIPVINFYYVASLPSAYHFFYSPFTGYYASVIPWLPPILLYLFYLGLFLALAKIVLIADKLKDLEKNKYNLDFKSDLLNIILLFSVIFAFVFILKIQAIEYRWFFMLLPAMFAFTSKTIILLSDGIQKYFKIKHLAIILILLIVLFGVYNQILHADNIIRFKLDSYSQVRDAGLWVRENSNKDDLVFSDSLPQNTYYSERKTYYLGANETEFYINLEEKNPEYIIISIFEKYADWALNPSQKFINITNPVKIFYLDQQEKQPALIIYEYKNN